MGFKCYAAGVREFIGRNEMSGDVIVLGKSVKKQAVTGKHVNKEHSFYTLYNTEEFDVILAVHRR